MTDKGEFNLIEEFRKHSSPALKSREGAFAAAAFVRESVKDSSPLVLVEKSSFATGDPWNLRHIFISETRELDELLALLGKIKQGLQDGFESRPD